MKVLMYGLIQGNTDSEHVFMMILNNLPNITERLKPKILLNAFKVNV